MNEVLRACVQSDRRYLILLFLGWVFETSKHSALVYPLRSLRNELLVERLV